MPVESRIERPSSRSAAVWRRCPIAFCASREGRFRCMI